jgi:hypothetical protein
MKAIDWNEEAVKMAQYVGSKMMSAHRGAMPWRQTGISVVFGNDDYDQVNEDDPEGPRGDPKTKAEVARVREAIEGPGGKVLGFGVDPSDGYSWAMLVENDDVEILNLIVWHAWDREANAGGDSGGQFAIAAAAIGDDGIRPDHSAN